MAHLVSMFLVANLFPNLQVYDWQFSLSLKIYFFSHVVALHLIDILFHERELFSL